tara:strand:+ start:551 stop:739 length:189 start_codon:yes stop_codon:yes gene_type:complete
MSRFKWYRRMVGGIWARVEYSRHAGYAEDHWVQMTELDFLHEDYFTNRVREVESYTEKAFDE